MIPFHIADFTINSSAAFHQMLSYLTVPRGIYNVADSAPVTRFFHQSRPVPAWRWGILQNHALYPSLSEVLELVKFTEPAMFGTLYFLQLGVHSFIVVDNEMWGIEELISCLRRRLTYRVAVQAAGVATVKTLDKAVNELHFTCDGWADPGEPHWDSDDSELPELIDSWI
ncbi:hypothetical protein K438DRAFT_1758693 [Mycena galopus ATCC 62051]|nr:hypothetical protein K438DRAFT_1758693 [Mycena galopus ATCC 62051]